MDGDKAQMLYDVKKSIHSGSINGDGNFSLVPCSLSENEGNQRIMVGMSAQAQRSSSEARRAHKSKDNDQAHRLIWHADLKIKINFIGSRGTQM
ncbi:hypothetical protein Ancab_032128 [Ancistrocladus abbreviatus]